VIPYAMGVETPVLPRSPEVWARNAICYVGRLELRKGVVEWVDAAVSVARSHTSVSFDFFGGDTYLGGGAGRSVLEFLKSRIPGALRDRFRFHGTKSQAELMDALANVAIAVVPSRWENFPFTCIEAMSTGLPVLASPNGGMAEMIVDGESGWIAADGSPAGLEAALLRALASSPAEREAMGQRAAETIRRICDNDAIVARHIALRKSVAEAGLTRSTHVAGVVDSPVVVDSARTGTGIVVTCFESPNHLFGCLESIGKQSVSTSAVVVADERLRSQLKATSIPVIFTSDRSAVRKMGLDALLKTEPHLRSIAIIDQDVRLEPFFAAACESVFASQPRVGLVLPWILRDGKRPDLDPGPSPLSLSTVAGTALPPYATIRTEILLNHSSPSWDSLATDNWTAFTYPAPLVTLVPPRGRTTHPSPKRRYSGMALIQSQSLQFALQWFMSAPLSEKARWLGRIARQPQRLTKWLEWQIRSRLGGTKSSKLN
jgi:glycogen(starch) synthase